MNVKKQLGTAAAIATVALAVAAPAVATDTPMSEDPGVAYFRANERATLVQSPGQAAIAYFRANERATMPFPAIVHDHGDATQAKLVAQTPAIEIIRDHGDATQAKLMAQTAALENTTIASEITSPSVQAEPTPTTGFDWQDAAVGASSALMLGLLVGGSLIVLRHSRGRELAR